MTEPPWWEGKSEEETQAHLTEVRARLEARAALEEHEQFEKAMAETPTHTWPPMPGTVHPSLADKAEWVRSLIARGEYTIFYHPPRRMKWTIDTEADVMADADPSRVLNVERVAAAAPWTEWPYCYEWRVAVGPDRRWIASDEVEVVRAPRQLGRQQ